MNTIKHIVRGFLAGSLLSWMTVSILRTQLEVLINSPLSDMMLVDLQYGYLNIREFYENIVYLYSMFFIMGFTIGFLWKPGSLSSLLK